MVDKPREKALEILYDIYKDGGFSNITIQKHLKDLDSDRDERFIRELVYGVLENDIFIEYIIGKLSKIKLSKIHLKILIIIKLAIYQIFFMEKIPPSAAVNEAVNLAKKHGHKGSIGFVNGILRNILRNKEDLAKIQARDRAEYISIKYSHPKILVDRWIKKYGEDFTEGLCKANNESPKLNIRVNQLKTNKDKLKDRLKDFSPRDGLYNSDILILDNPVKLTESQEFKLGYFTIQDESSSLVAEVMDPKAGSVVIDLCSAPGGKSTHIGEKMNNQGRIYSTDIHDHKLRLVEENAKRLGVNIIETSISDARVFNEKLVGVADYLLIDAPCSGFGLIRRKPEIKWNRSFEDIKSLVKLQKTILSNSKKYLKSGGFLIYSTCTIEEDENINMVREFLNENKEFTLVPIENPGLSLDKFPTLKDGYIQLFPHIDHTDGFFIAKMMKE